MVNVKVHIVTGYTKPGQETKAQVGPGPTWRIKRDARLVKEADVIRQQQRTCTKRILLMKVVPAPNLVSPNSLVTLDLVYSPFADYE
jgi:hypothetical protein